MNIKNVKVTSVIKLNNSINGNPKYSFDFEDVGVMTTPSDAGWVYAFSTDTFWDKLVNISYHMTKSGHAILDSIKEA